MRDIIYYANTDFYRIWQRPQHIAVRLARKHRVFYISPPFSILDPLVAAVFKGRKKGEYSLKSSLVEEENNLYVFTPPLMSPKYINLLTALNSRLMPRLIDRHIKELGFEQPILWLSNPQQIGITGYYDRNPVVYDIMDAYRFFHLGISRPSMAHFEKRLLEAAGAIFTCSDTLVPAEMLSSPKVTMLYNAAETDHFDPSRVGDDIDSEILSIPEPRLGFVGYIGRWFDVEAVRYTALRHPEWSFVLVGPVHIALRELEELDNVHILGARPYEIVPNIVQGFDICLLPFKEDRILGAIDAVKLYEYLAMEKPVVAYRLKRLENFDGLCSPYDTKEEMVEVIEEHLSTTDSDEIKDARRRFALNNSWDKRCELVEEVLLGLEPRP